MSAHIVSVTGGRPPCGPAGFEAGLEVSCRAVLELAADFDDLAATLAVLAARTAAAVGDAHLVESAALAPRSFAVVEGAIAVLATETLACAAAWEGAALGCRELVRTLLAIDAAHAVAMQGIDRLLAAAVLAAPLAATPALLADPALLQRVVAGLPVRLAARLLGGWSDGGVRVVPGLSTCSRPPTGVGDLMQRLERVADMADGTIDVETHELPDGTRAHVVYLPGTDQMWSAGFTSEVRDLKENGRLLLGEPTVHAAGVETALAIAGVAPGEQVLLVGHSQGGMQAAQLLVHGSGYNVTNVVTAGSPIAGAGSFPPGSHVLSLENRHDLVPSLDGAPNPPAPEHVTVTFDDGPDDPLGSHGLRHYADGAAAVDTSHDPAVRGSLASLQPFFASADVTSQLFVMSRAVPRQD